jgi:hypothetical protein
MLCLTHKIQDRLYGVAYAYELGYARFFSIPLFLIQPTISIILAVVFALTFTALSLAQGVALLRLALASVPAGFRAKVYLTVFMSLVALATMGFTWSALAAIIFFIFIFCGLHIVVLIFGSGTWRERLEEADSSPDRLHRFDPISSPVLGPLAAGVIVIGMFLVLLAVALGALAARTQVEFNVVEARPDVALVRQYGDLMVGVKFNETAKRATGEVVIFKLGDEFKQLNLTVKRVGPLAGKDQKFLEHVFD